MPRPRARITTGPTTGTWAALQAGMSEHKKRMLGAGAGGIVGTAIDVAVLAALIHAGAAVALAAFLGSASGAGVCFVINKYVAFRDHRPVDVRQVASFAAVALVTSLLMAGAMHVACVGAHLPYLLAKLVCAALVFGCWSYPAQRRLVFVSPA